MPKRMMVEETALVPGYSLNLLHNHLGDSLEVPIEKMDIRNIKVPGSLTICQVAGPLGPSLRS